jgi:nucleoside phosphorylase
VILVVAATARELAGAGETPTLACGIGPVEAAATTARALTVQKPEAVLHVGIAGARGIPAPQLVIGSESIYEDAAQGGLVKGRVVPDTKLVEAARRAIPEAQVRPIGTSARVGGTSGCDVEAMEGFAVLRAAALAGVPAVEVRAISNELGEEDRTRWQVPAALDLLGTALAGLVTRLEEALREVG